MNGRIYDPLLGRFLSADIVVQAPGSLQSYNRYSYVMNNPLTLTDPSGFFWDPNSGVWGGSEWATFAKALVSDNANTAGIADSAVSTVTAPLNMIAAGSGGPVGIPGMGGMQITTPEQFQAFQAQQQAGQQLGQAITQAGRDGVTAVTGVADNNAQRRTAEVATDVATIAVGVTKVGTSLVKAADNAIKTGLKSEIAAAKSVASEAKAEVKATSAATAKDTARGEDVAAALGRGSANNPGAAISAETRQKLGGQMERFQKSADNAQKGLSPSGKEISPEQAARQLKTAQQRLDEIKKVLESGEQLPKRKI